MTVLPLSDLTILDLARVRSGPTCVRQFADWGANVIKIEVPDAEGVEAFTGNRMSSDFQNLHRNKRSMTLNLKADEGREIFYKLVETADVVVENYRPDVKKRLKVDYDSLKAINPRIILGSISGFGQDGPYANRPGFDQIAQGMGGLMSVTGLPGQGPVRAGVPIADLTAGLYCAIGILIALHHRTLTGEGQWVHSSLLEAEIAMLDFQATRWLIDKEIPPQAGNFHPTGAATGVYKTTDGYINIAPGGDAQFKRMCEVIGAPEIAADPRFKDRPTQNKNREALYEALSACFITNASAYWVETLNEVSVPCGPIYNIKEVFEDPQVKHVGMAAPVEHPTMGRIELNGQAANLSSTPFVIRSATPEQGEHTDDILTGLGMSAAEIAALREKNVI